ncbi:unnamed protein product [Caenorhabditis bovis]|uniref:Uncharacterized protein n=1 Tax=Caenorhabditis bovis TaxID=2654633 RepID=A0A8S1ENM7_9PELO|nr:unnamed protein product [Caenorhabditis bovis]
MSSDDGHYSDLNNIEATFPAEGMGTFADYFDANPFPDEFLDYADDIFKELSMDFPELSQPAGPDKHSFEIPTTLEIPLAPVIEQHMSGSAQMNLCSVNDQSGNVDERHKTIAVPTGTTQECSRILSQPHVNARPGPSQPKFRIVHSGVTLIPGQKIIEDLKNDPIHQLPIQEQPTVRQVVLSQMAKVNPEMANKILKFQGMRADAFQRCESSIKDELIIKLDTDVKNKDILLDEEIDVDPMLTSVAAPVTNCGVDENMMESMSTMPIDHVDSNFMDNIDSIYLDSRDSISTDASPQFSFEQLLNNESSVQSPINKIHDGCPNTERSNSISDYPEFNSQSEGSSMQGFVNLDEFFTDIPFNDAMTPSSSQSSSLPVKTDLENMFNQQKKVNPPNMVPYFEYPSVKNDSHGLEKKIGEKPAPQRRAKRRNESKPKSSKKKKQNTYIDPATISIMDVPPPTPPPEPPTPPPPPKPVRVERRIKFVPLKDLELLSELNKSQPSPPGGLGSAQGSSKRFQEPEEVIEFMPKEQLVKFPQHHMKLPIPLEPTQIEPQQPSENEPQRQRVSTQGEFVPPYQKQEPVEEHKQQLRMYSHQRTYERPESSQSKPMQTTQQNQPLRKPQNKEAQDLALIRQPVQIKKVQIFQQMPTHKTQNYAKIHQQETSEQFQPKILKPAISSNDAYLATHVVTHPSKNSEGPETRQVLVFMPTVAQMIQKNSIVKISISPTKKYVPGSAAEDVACRLKSQSYIMKQPVRVETTTKRPKELHKNMRKPSQPTLIIQAPDQEHGQLLAQSSEQYRGQCSESNYSQSSQIFMRCSREPPIENAEFIPMQYSEQIAEQFEFIDQNEVPEHLLENDVERVSEQTVAHAQGHVVVYDQGQAIVYDHDQPAVYNQEQDILYDHEEQVIYENGEAAVFDQEGAVVYNHGEAVIYDDAIPHIQEEVIIETSEPIQAKTAPQILQAPGKSAAQTLGKNSMNTSTDPKETAKSFKPPVLEKSSPPIEPPPSLELMDEELFKRYQALKEKQSIRKLVAPKPLKKRLPPPPEDEETKRRIETIFEQMRSEKELLAASSAQKGKTLNEKLSSTTTPKTPKRAASRANALKDVIDEKAGAAPQLPKGVEQNVENINPMTEAGDVQPIIVSEHAETGC